VKSLVRIGSRKSELALVQTKAVCTALATRHPEIQFEIVPIVTSGDRKQGTPAEAAGDKKDWVAEIETAIQNNEIDLAVHSAKDVPVEIAQGTALIPVLERESPCDVLVSESGIRTLADPVPGDRIGTASVRRIAQVLAQRPDLRLEPVRGNVPTRIRKLRDDIQLRAIIIAEAGLRRLALDCRYSRLDPLRFLPAVNQGILLAQYRSADQAMEQALSALRHEPTCLAYLAERECVSVIGADCHSAIGVFAEYRSGELQLTAKVLSIDGRSVLEFRDSASPAEAKELGQRAAEALLRKGAAELLAAGG
jgi:hydroxymethylbilane synthase